MTPAACPCTVLYPAGSTYVHSERPLSRCTTYILLQTAARTAQPREEHRPLIPLPSLLFGLFRTGSRKRGVRRCFLSSPPFIPSLSSTTSCTASATIAASIPSRELAPQVSRQKLPLATLAAPSRPQPAAASNSRLHSSFFFLLGGYFSRRVAGPGLLFARNRM